ncbi:MAG: tetratricopeptide repeat protein [Spirochaetaceae bacterium]|nr:tetratricopeptide repeat protein [Spirochaetaceae bacterium]
MRNRERGRFASRFAGKAVFFLFLRAALYPVFAEEPPGPSVPASLPSRPAGVADEIRALVEMGTPPALLEARDLIRARNLEGGEFGRTMLAVIARLLWSVYPGAAADLPPSDPPQTHIYARLLREAERGNYTAPSVASRDYLEITLPFLALLEETRTNRLSPALRDLERARTVNPASPLAPYFLGIINERTGNMEGALAFYGAAYRLSADCYPALQGRARILEERGERAQAVSTLEELAARYPNNLSVRRQLAAALYRAGDWVRAEPAIADVLRRDPSDSRMTLARAHVLVEQGKYLAAQAPLDAYGAVDPQDRLYLLLRARLQDQGYRNRDAALTYLKTILRANPLDATVSVYAARLLLESNRAEEQAEGRNILSRLLAEEHPPEAVRDLAMEDAIRRESWREARELLAPLLRERHSGRDLLNSWTIERGLGNNAAALQAARELYRLEPANEEGIITYISALIDTGRLDEARGLIEQRLQRVSGGTLKARYYYLRSRLASGDDQIIADLRSSLFEDPRNLDALTGMVEIYHRRKDERRVIYYLRLALAIAPDNPRLRRREAEYAALPSSGR